MEYFLILASAILIAAIYKKASKKAKVDAILKKINLNTTNTTNPNPTPHPTKYQAITEWEKGLKLLKNGKGEKIEFTYETIKNGKQRRKITLDKIMTNEDENIYLYGTCLDKMEKRTFNINKISTMLLVKGKRHEVMSYLIDEYDL